MIATLVPAEDWATVWKLAAPLLAPAFAHGGDYAVTDAPTRLSSGEWGLWIVVADGALIAACITEIVDFPRRRKLWVVSAGGEMRRGVPALWPLMQQAAKDNGCAAVAWSGRRGWMRSGAIPDGWRHVAEIVEVEL